ncbi:uncharacterized protein LOC135477976 [Liolophura sinensis]|uniref:uncharacterized protein LOC135477976 n=1 Tax=Liolophura sinensis TaxID=3198878 RepID=UPI0031591C15
MVGKLFICTAMLFAACQATVLKQYCLDTSGNSRRLGEEWDEGDKRCECIRSDLFYMEGGNDNSDPVKNCLWNGCPDPSGGPILKDGDEYQDKYGYTCTCKFGSDPFLADAYTLYHVECFPTIGVENSED